MSLLETIQSPLDLKKLELPQLETLAGEVRAFMVNAVSKTGGHLASSLGAVELTIALHRVFDTPRDRIVWDVGHQTYAHKLLTGRRERFHTLRQFGGLSGFPKREESKYDAFNTGHSSTSISAALGMARARDCKGQDHRVLAVIGDGSLSNGLAFEALNDAGHQKTNLLVILNDNRMSISPPVGGLSNYLNHIITGRAYNRLKLQMENMVASIPAVGKPALKLTNYLEEIAKGLVIPGVLFEELGFRYFGPVAGHDLDQLITTLERVRELPGPILLHVLTIKGKGFEPAEKNSTAFHGVSAFDPETGRPRGAFGLTFSKAFSQSLLHFARADKNIIAVVAAMTSGTALDEFAAELPGQFFDVGIAESHAVTMAAGMAADGLRPVVVIYSTFLQRAYDQILHDVCQQNLPVVFILDRAGVVGEDGPTHHGIFDLAYLRHLPNLVIFAPSDERELTGMLKTALTRPGPTAIRYPRGRTPGQVIDFNQVAIDAGQARVLRPGRDVVLLGLGNMLVPCLQAAESLAKKGVNAMVIDPRSVKPLDAKILVPAIKAAGRVVTVEDHVQAGGFGSAVMEMLQAHALKATVHCLGWPDEFVEQGAVEELFKKHHLLSVDIEKVVLQGLNRHQAPGAGRRAKTKIRTKAGRLERQRRPGP